MITEITATILLADNGHGDGGWIQLVVFIVLGLIYALGGLAKMKANKVFKEDEDNIDDKPQRRPRYKPLDETFSPRQSQSKRVPAPSPGTSRTTPRPVRQIHRPTRARVHHEYKQPARVQEPPKRPVRPASRPKLREAVRKNPPVSAASYELAKIEKPEGEPSQKQQLTEVSEFTDRPVFDYEDSDSLRNAILHYEILGKPMALRESGRYIWEQ